MIPPIRVLFDECIPRRVVGSLKELIAANTLGQEVIVSHLLDLLNEGIPDSEWVPRVADEGWIIISGDTAKGLRGGKNHLQDV